MKESIIKTLTNLDNAFGGSGNEEEVSAVMRNEMEGLYEEHTEDPQGNQIFIKYGSDRDRKVVLSAHMDEIGFIINYIEDNGMARFLPVGYHDDRTAVNQDMVVMTESGEKVYGVTGSKPAHIMTEEDHEKVIKIDELFLDFGTASSDETRALGVEVGDYVGYAREGKRLNDGKCYTGKSVDDRAGCAVLVEVLKQLKGVDLAPTICMVGSTQEEVGMRAGGPLATRLNHELFLAIDVTITGDTPGVKMRECSQEMGAGPGIKYYDWDTILGATGNNVPRRMTRTLIQPAEKHAIPSTR